MGKDIPKLWITPWNGTSRALLLLPAKQLRLPRKIQKWGENGENPSGGQRGGSVWDFVVSIGPSGSRPAAPAGISVVREGIVMSHAPAKVLPGGKGGPGREISKHGNVYLEFGLKERFCEIQREDCLGMKPAGYWISPAIQGKKLGLLQSPEHAGTETPPAVLSLSVKSQNP